MKKLKDAWDLLTRVLFCEKTNLIYDSVCSRDPERRFDHLPWPEEIAQNLPNPCGWGTGMEDSMLNAGPALDAALLRAEAEPESREEALSFARKLVSGMELCTTVHGVSGYVARSVSPRDGRSCYINSSRDQFTFYTYGLWRFYHSAFADENDRTRIRTLLRRTADYCEYALTREGGRDLLRLDGRRGIVTGVIGAMCHEEYRLPMFFLAAYDCGGGEKYLKRYESLADHALDVTETLSESQNLWWQIALSQLQASLTVGAKADPDPARNARIRKSWRLAAELAERHFRDAESAMLTFRGAWDKLAVPWTRAWKMSIVPGTLREDGPSLYEGKFYLKPWEDPEFLEALERMRALGNLAFAAAVCEDRAPAPDFPGRYDAAADVPGYAVHATASVCNILLGHYHAAKWKKTP